MPKIMEIIEKETKGKIGRGVEFFEEAFGKDGDFECDDPGICEVLSYQFLPPLPIILY